MNLAMISIVRDDNSVIIVPKTVVLDYLSEISRESVLKRIMSLEEYHLSSDLNFESADGYFDYNRIYERRKSANSYGGSYLVFFHSFKPKNVPYEILEQYGNYLRKHPNVCLEYFLIYYHDKTDFTVEEQAVEEESNDMKCIKNLKNMLLRDGRPSIAEETKRQHIPILRKPLAEMDDSEIDAYFAIPPWMRNKMPK